MAFSLLLGISLIQSTAHAQAIRNGAIYRVEPQCAVGSALDVSANSTADGAKIHIWFAAGVRTNQQWKAISVSGGYWEFEPQHALGKRLTVSGDGISSGTDVLQKNGAGLSTQRWKAIINSDGTVALEPASSPGKRLDVTGAVSTNGTVVQIYNANTSSAQKWKFFAVKPNSSTTGVPAGTTLEVVSGNVTASTSNFTYTAKDFRGFVHVGAANVNFRNCIFRGGTSYSSGRGLVTCTATSTQNLVIEDCTFVPQTPSFYANGIVGHDFTLRRCNIYNVVDGVNIHNTAFPGGVAVNVVMESNYIHDLAFFSPSPTNSDNKTHNDCIQIMGGSNIRIAGNNFLGMLSTTAGTLNTRPASGNANAVFMIKPDVSQIAGLDIARNWMDGGMFTVNIANDTDSGHTVMLGNIGEISYNQFGRNQGIQGPGGDSTYTISMPSNVSCTTTGNVYEDNGHAILVRHNG